jgi:hypothetical protein
MRGISKRHILVFVTIFVVTAACVRLGSHSILYGVGRGALEYRWAFLSGPPLVMAASVLGAAMAFGACVVLRIERSGRIVSLVFVGLILLSFAVNPTWRTADSFICRGLVRRITDGGADRRLTQYLQSTLAEHPDKATNAMVNLTDHRPPWLQQLFPESHVMVDLYNGEVRCLCIQVGGPLLRYGCYIGMGASEILPLRGDPMSVNVASNIIVYAE